MFLKDDESMEKCVCVFQSLCGLFSLGVFSFFCLVVDPSFKKIVGKRLSSQTTSGVTRT